MPASLHGSSGTQPRLPPEMKNTWYVTPTKVTRAHSWTDQSLKETLIQYLKVWLSQVTAWELTRASSTAVLNILSPSSVLRSLWIRQEKEDTSERTSSVPASTLISISRPVQVLSFAVRKQLLSHPSKVKEVCPDLNRLSLQQRDSGRSLPISTTLRLSLTFPGSYITEEQHLPSSVLKSHPEPRYSLLPVRSRRAV